MGHYRSNLTDTEFTLFDVFGRGDLLGSGPYADLDEDTAREALAEIDRLARDEIAASFEHGDRNPPDYDPTTGEVHLSDEFRRSFDAWMNSEWWRLEIPAELGGQPCPPSLRWAVAELALGANPALFMYASGPQFAHAIWRNGTAEQKRLAQRMVDNHWAATMVLTEPDAGSDVGAGRAKAYPQPDGTWHLEGVKRFITSGEHDLTSNIVHLVLARPVGVEGAGGPGTKGLSLFLVPKYHVDPETGELGDRNGVKATNVEHKMGLKVSATCELTFGGDTPAVGTLLGDVHNGIAQMFQIIEYARMLVGTKAIGTLSSGYLNALEYAKERVQGADMTRSGDKSAPRVTITNHPDVRRSLMAQKAYAEGLRALVIYTATVQDDVELASASGTDNADAERLNDLLLPLVKGYGSEKAWVLLGTEGLQTFGGSGFLQDYPLEQYVRDAKIDTLYEGTTAIQGLDLFFRKIVKDNGQALGQLAGEIGKFAHASGVSGDSADSSDADGDDVDGDQLRTERQLLARALEDAQAMVGGLITNAMRSNPKFAPDGEADPSELYTVGAHTSRLLLCLGDVVCAWLLLRKAEIAQAKLAELEGFASGREAGDQQGAADQQGVSGGAQGATGGRGAADARGADFYRGKVAAARWFCREVLPKLSAERQIVESADNSLMDLPESAF